jgi:hypothetical protein
MGNQNPIKPGTICPDSGIFKEVGSRGGKTGREVTVREGEPMPPCQKPGGGFLPHHTTKHKNR